MPLRDPPPYDCLDDGRRFFFENVGQYFYDLPARTVAAGKEVRPVTCLVCGKRVDGLGRIARFTEIGTCLAQSSLTAPREKATMTPDEIAARDAKMLKSREDYDKKLAKARGAKPGKAIAAYGAPRTAYNAFAERTGAFVTERGGLVMGNVKPDLELPPGIVHVHNGGGAALQRLFTAAFLEDFEPPALLFFFSAKKTDVPFAVTRSKGTVMFNGGQEPLAVSVARVRELHAIATSLGRDRFKVAMRTRDNAMSGNGGQGALDAYAALMTEIGYRTLSRLPAKGMPEAEILDALLWTPPPADAAKGGGRPAKATHPAEAA